MDLRHDLLSACALAVTCGVATSSHTLASEDLNALSLLPRGSVVEAGHEALAEASGATYCFQYRDASGALELEYVIDMDHPDVQAGMIRVAETVSGAVPVAKGGLAWRQAGTLVDPCSDGAFWRPPELAALALSTVLVQEHFDPLARQLVLTYAEEVTEGGTTVAAQKTYEFTLVGKVLRIRAHADESVNNSYFSNYGYFDPGPSEGTPNAREQHIPYMDNATVVGFGEVGVPDHHFYSLQLDYYKSAGSSMSVPLGGFDPPHPDPGQEQYEHFYAQMTLPANEAGTLAVAVVDETLNLVVTDRIQDTFAMPPHYRSPYYALGAGRMEIFSSEKGPDAWPKYSEQYEKFSEWGMFDLNIQQFQTGQWGTTLIMIPSFSSASIMGCSIPGVLAVIASDEDAFPADSEGVRMLDVEHPAVADLVEAEFGALSYHATASGALFAHQVNHESSDQAGDPLIGDGPCENTGLPAPMAYDTSLAFYKNGWFAPGSIDKYGTTIPGTNLEHEAAWLLTDYQGEPTSGWDNRANLENTSFSGTGYKLTNVDTLYAVDHISKQADFGFHGGMIGGHDYPGYEANAIRWDATAAIPNHLHIDHDPSSPRSHSTAEVLKRKTRAYRELRERYGAPIYGESQYWRKAQAYAHGARDGYTWHFPPQDVAPVLLGNRLGYVIPDYNLDQVLAKASGTSGMGSEVAHWDFRPDLSEFYPVDGKQGDGNSYFGTPHAFLDSWFTSLATFGNNAHALSYGHQLDTPWTYQGMLLGYYLMNGLTKGIRQVTERIVLYDYEGGEYDLSELMTTIYANAGSGVQARGTLDSYLKYPRIHVVHGSGPDAIHVYANHSLDPWVVSVAFGPAMVSLDLESHGFAFTDAGDLFGFFNAHPSGESQPFDYARLVGQYEMINNRTDTPPGPGYSGALFNGFPASVLASAGFDPAEENCFSEGLVVRNEVLNRTLGAVGGRWDYRTGTWKQGGDPDACQGVVREEIVALNMPVGLELRSEEDTVLRGKAVGVIAIAIHENGAERDVTTLVDWSLSGASGTARIDARGVVRVDPEHTPTTVQVGATWGGAPYLSGTLDLIVADGLPSPAIFADTTSLPGQTIRLDGSSSFDPKGGPLDFEWDFGDGASARGPVVEHTFQTPGAYDVTLTIMDVEENASSEVHPITVADEAPLNAGLPWADDFGDGRLDGWRTDLPGLWGVRKGRACQSQSGGTGAVLETHSVIGPHASLCADFQMGPENSSSIGAYLSGDTDSGAKGYRVDIRPNGKLFLSWDSGVVSTLLDPFDDDTVYELRLVTMPDGADTRVRVFIDQALALEHVGPTPNPGHAGLTSNTMVAHFDDVHVTAWDAPFVRLGTTATGPGQRRLDLFIHEPNGTGTLNLSSFELTVRNRDADGTLLQEQVFSGSALVALMGSYWAIGSGTDTVNYLASTVETWLGADASVEFTFEVTDQDGNVNRQSEIYE